MSAQQDQEIAPTKLWTIRAIAEFAGVSIMTVRRWIEEEGLRVHHLGRLVRVTQADFAAFLASRRDRRPAT